MAITALATASTIIGITLSVASAAMAVAESAGNYDVVKKNAALKQLYDSVIPAYIAYNPDYVKII